MRERFICPVLAGRPPPPSELALVGFSQGTMMALHVGLRRPTAPLAIVGYSGLLVEPPEAQAETFLAEIKAPPPILLVHGDHHGVLPVQASLHPTDALGAAGAPTG